jgi:4-amino-4-deoxy-L-arabinose transferase-like glycosyltransferase
VTIVGLVWGSLDAGGSDVYGYVSQGELWAQGNLRLEQPLVDDLDWDFDIDVLTPLGYRFLEDRRTIVSVYSPGLPLVLALFQRLGGRPAVFYVVPLLGGLLVWATYQLGSRVGGREVGLAAAVLMASAPAFLFQLMFAMSDVPVATWWSLALWLIVADPPVLALFSGLAAGMAILTRPNLVVLAIVPGTWLLWRALRDQGADRPARRRLMLFCPGVVAACVALTVINARVNGSPFVSSYGPNVTEVFGLADFWTNAALYTTWLFRSSTPIVALSLVGPFYARATAGRDAREVRGLCWMLLIFAAAVFASYLFYDVFHDWWYLRFVLSAYPAIFILTSLALLGLLRRLIPRNVVPLASLTIVLVAWYGIGFAHAHGTFLYRQGDRRYSAVGRYIAEKLPERSVFLSMSHSGSVRYYAGRLTVRHDLIPSEKLGTVLWDLQRLGYHPYILLDEWEEEGFRTRFRDHPAGSLDWPPVALLNHSSPVRIYDPADRLAPNPPQRRTDVFSVSSQSPPAPRTPDTRPE